MTLRWPLDPLPGIADDGRLDVPLANRVLDLHGSPLSPQLVLFMAGNQFPVLPALIDAFGAEAGITRVFHVTTPPGRLIDALQRGHLVVGNLVLELRPDGLWPDVFMAGAAELGRLQALGLVQTGTRPRPYARSRGVALLVRAGNPLDIRGVGDLVRPDVRVAISSPDREPASFDSYGPTLDAQGGPGFADAVLAQPRTVRSRQIHHREVPQLIADGRADVGPLYHHLAEHLVATLPAVFGRVPLPAHGNVRAELAAVPLQAAPRPEAARRWCDFLGSARAATLLDAHGFDPVAAA